MRNYRFILLGLLCLSLPAFALDQLTLMLDWFPNPNHAPIYVAIQQGYFKAENLKVTLITPANPADPAKFIMAKKVDLGLGYHYQLLQLVSQGLPLIRIATLIATPLDTLIVPAQGSIKQIKDLKGKRLGYSGDIQSLGILTTMLKTAGLSLADVNLINVHYNLTQALLSRQVDAITGAMRNFEPIQLAGIGYQMKLFYPEEQGIPPYDELIILSHKDMRYDARLGRFLRALERGTQYLINHPQESWQMFVKAHPELNDRLNKEAWFQTLPRFALRPAAMDNGRYRNFARFLKNQKLILSEPALVQYAIEVPR